MKSMIIIASLIAVALAGPAHRNLVAPGMPGPTPIIDNPISVGPAILDFEPVAIGPALLDTFEPIAIGPAIVDSIQAPPATGTPTVQIIININKDGQVESIIPSPVAPEIVPEPVHVVEDAAEVLPDPVIIGNPTLPSPVPEPVVIGNPTLPSPVPEPVVIGNPTLPSPVPEPVIVGTPIIPAPAVVLPEVLN